ncbi:hypothetical protein [Mycolicibacterium llatzerense]|nr:hypothetical protein [Mycolicibacterium llatzerense]
MSTAASAAVARTTPPHTPSTTIPRTISGKRQRARVKQQYLAGELR